MAVNTVGIQESIAGLPDGHGRRSHWHDVYLETRRRILTLELAPGTPLSEAEVAREFGVSATPARHALGSLRQEGLIVLGAGGGHAVAGLSISDVAHLAEARYVIESGIVQVAMSKAQPWSLARVRDLGRALEDSSLEPTEIINRNQTFHVGIAELTENPRLVEAARRVIEDSCRVFHLGIRALPIKGMVETHRQLVDAIEAKDLAAALALCEIEAFGTSERVIAQLMRGAESRAG